jgi:hypothetical protein
VPRLIVAAISSFVALGFCAYSVATTWVYPANALWKGGCDDWLDRPATEWVSLRGCVLDVDLVVLESDQGDFETLANRQQGLSMKPYGEPQNWVAVWIPVRTPFTGSGLVRAAYRIESADVLKWVNELERGDDRKKERMWADRSTIRRLSRPGVLTGKADKPGTEGVQKAFGAAASANLLAVTAGDPPPVKAPAAGIFSGLLGLVLLGFLVRRRALEPASAEQQITSLNVSDVKLEIGALEELRREERGNRSNQKID